MIQSKSKVTSVGSVDLVRYTGTWYEIARLPNRFEKNLKNITANYTLRDDGRINVLNKGVRTDKDGKIDSAHGIAWLPDKSVTSRLKVRFFWPFSGDYWVLKLDPEYRFVLVGEPSCKYLWILSRTPQLDENIVEDLLRTAQEMGFDTTKMIYDI
jgi:apolipoprotein D and lipocalin family protein